MLRACVRLCVCVPVCMGMPRSACMGVLKGEYCWRPSFNGPLCVSAHPYVSKCLRGWVGVGVMGSSVGMCVCVCVCVCVCLRVSLHQYAYKRTLASVDMRLLRGDRVSASVCKSLCASVDQPRGSAC